MAAKAAKKLMESIRRLIKKKLPDQLGLPFGLWTREAVGQLIFEKFGISLSRWQVGRYLKSWGKADSQSVRTKTCKS